MIFTPYVLSVSVMCTVYMFQFKYNHLLILSAKNSCPVIVRQDVVYRAYTYVYIILYNHLFILSANDSCPVPDASILAITVCQLRTAVLSHQLQYYVCIVHLSLVPTTICWVCQLRTVYLSSVQPAVRTVNYKNSSPVPVS